MPVSVVCESSANVNAALRESLGSCSSAAAAAAEDAKAGSSMYSSDGVDYLQSKLAASAKRVLLSKIEYEEVSNYSNSILDTLKSKYIVLKPNNNGENGRASPAVTCNNNGHNGSAADANGNSAGSGKQRPNPNELPAPKRILYPRENIRIGWKNSVRKWQVGVGMMNVGNTCYLNSTLQALFHVPSMANWLMSDTQHMDRCDAADAGCIICAMAKTLQASQSSQSAIRPYFVYSKLKSICKHLVMGRQEDAHEFLRYLVEAMEKSYLSRLRNYKDLDQYTKETTPLNQILGGYLKSAVRCLACGHVSVTFQHFQDLLLDIRKADTVEEAMDGYFSRERLEDMGYKCEACKKKVSATKQFSLERAPIALCIQLKRFSMIGTKINKQITIKPRLDLTKFSSRKTPGEQLSYKLVAMVTHLGASQHCGHYTAIGLTESGTYYNYDDSYVRSISVQNVCNTNAYIIFYELDNATQRQVSSTQVSGGDSKENYQKVNGYGVNKTNNRSASPQRIIGPQLPPAGLSSYTASSNKNGNGGGSPYTNGGGSKLSVNRQNAIPTNNNNNNPNSSKIMINFKNNNAAVKSQASSSSTTTSATATSSSAHNGNGNGTQLQNGLHTGTGKFQESTHSKSTLAGASAKGQAAAVSNGNESSPNSTDHEDEVSSSTQSSARKSLQIGSSSSKASSLPSMPKLFDNGSAVSAAKKSSTPPAPKSPFKSLVPYESESDDEDAAAPAQEAKRAKCNTSANTTDPQTSGKNPLKRRNSTSSSSDQTDDDADAKPSNGIKVKKAATTTTTTSSSLNSINTTSTSTNGNSSQQSKANKQKTGAIDEIFNSINKRNVISNSNHNNHNTGNTNTPSKKQQQKSHSHPFLVTSTTRSTDSDDDDCDTFKHGVGAAHKNGHTPFKRANSTPPSPPVIKTKTGLWQVTTLQPVTANISPPAQKAAKNPKNPFASKPVAELSDKRPKANAEKRNVSFPGNGYQRDSSNSNAVSELLKQSHRGYGAPVLTWNGEQTDIEKEIIEETRVQRQRDWEEEEEEDQEMDRGRQKKTAKQPKESNGHLSTPGYNPFQELEKPRRWKGSSSSGSAPQRFHGGHFRNQFQRNKFKFQRFNHKFQRTHQRNNNGNSNGGSGYSRRDS